MSTFPTTGSFPFEVTSEASKPKVGTIVLTYTPEPDGSIKDASIRYDPENGDKSQTIHIAFGAMTAAPYEGKAHPEPIPNNWNVPGQGAYKYATFKFSPPAGTFAGTFTGKASKNPIKEDNTTITWEADPSTTPPKGPKQPTRQPQGAQVSASCEPRRNTDECRYDSRFHLRGSALIRGSHESPRQASAG